MSIKTCFNNKGVHRLFFLIALFALVFSFPVLAAKGKITITGSRLVAKGKTIRLSADQDVSWESSNPSVVMVSGKGKVKGLQAGSAVITATSKKNQAVKAQIKIRVKKKAVRKIKVSVKDLSLDVTQKPSASIKARAVPAKAAQKFTWSSNAPEVAKVSSGGSVTALKPGKAVLTCRAVDGSKKKVSIRVTVTNQEEEERERKRREEQEEKDRKEQEKKDREEQQRAEAAAKEAAYCNILLIGNSYTHDEFGYVPALLKEFFPSLKFRIGLLYTGGCSLALHHSNLTSNGSYQTYSEYTSEDTCWTHKSNVPLSEVITKYTWKIVTLQQYSGLQGDYTSMQPYLEALLSGYAKKMGRQPVFLYVFPHVRGSKNSLISSSTGTTAAAYASYVQIVKTVMGTYRFTGMIPSATAIENARTTALGQLGDGGDMTSDTTHLQDGLPCLVANYCSFLKLLPYIGIGQVDLYKSRILPTKAWIAAQKVPGADGKSVGATEENRQLAAKCALKAVQEPWSVSSIS